MNDQPLYALTEMSVPGASSTLTVVVGVAESLMDAPLI